MRTIKFRGRKSDSKTWVYGTPVFYKSGEASIFPSLSEYGSEATEIIKRDKIDPKTIGQFTGLTDKNGVEIFEGDIVEWPTDIDRDYYNESYRFVREEVKFEGGAFYPVCNMDEYEFKVIGNIYENPELLK